MKYKFKERSKFKHIRRNIFDIPTGELETPLTNGFEVLEFLMTVANKERYQFKARGRGSRKVYGNSYDIPIEHAEKKPSAVGRGKGAVKKKTGTGKGVRTEASKARARARGVGTGKGGLKKKK